jgi:hypothetical protein
MVDLRRVLCHRSGHKVPYATGGSERGRDTEWTEALRFVSNIYHFNIGAQQGFCTGLGSINSTRVKFGS